MIAARQIIEFVNEVAVVSACVQVDKQLGDGDGEESYDAKINPPPVLVSSLVQRRIRMHLCLYCDFKRQSSWMGMSSVTHPSIGA